jgi:hypothetical protein
LLKTFQESSLRKVKECNRVDRGRGEEETGSKIELEDEDE